MQYGLVLKENSCSIVLSFQYNNDQITSLPEFYLTKFQLWDGGFRAGDKVCCQISRLERRGTFFVSYSRDMGQMVHYYKRVIQVLGCMTNKGLG